MISLLEKIEKKVRPALQSKFGFTNPNMTPRLVKVVLNSGIRSDLKDPKLIEDFIKDIQAITGQTPVKTLSKKSISSFKIREGQVVGLVVTLRGKRMYEFLDKLINVTLARVRDFRGLDEKGFDRSGNYSLGLRDQVAFPEISADSVSHPFGMQITIHLQTPSQEAAKEFFKLIGMPIKPKELKTK